MDLGTTSHDYIGIIAGIIIIISVIIYSFKVVGIKNLMDNQEENWNSSSVDL